MNSSYTFCSWRMFIFGTLVCLWCADETLVWIVTVSVLWLFLTVPWVGLQRVIVIFPDHTHLLFGVGDMTLKFKFNVKYN